MWRYNASTLGNDYYGFALVPAGQRAHDGNNYRWRGIYMYYMSSSAIDATYYWVHIEGYDVAGDNRTMYFRSHGEPVRCIRN
jgi:uncharacterized protein (TIGR02145 family)